MNFLNKFVVGMCRVDVVEIIHHSYESDCRVKLELSKLSLVEFLLASDLSVAAHQLATRAEASLSLSILSRVGSLLYEFLLLFRVLSIINQDPKIGVTLNYWTYFFFFSELNKYSSSSSLISYSKALLETLENLSWVVFPRKKFLQWM